MNMEIKRLMSSIRRRRFMEGIVLYGSETGLRESVLSVALERLIEGRMKSLN